MKRAGKGPRQGRHSGHTPGTGTGVTKPLGPGKKAGAWPGLACMGEETVQGHRHLVQKGTGWKGTTGRPFLPSPLPPVQALHFGSIHTSQDPGAAKLAQNCLSRRTLQRQQGMGPVLSSRQRETVQ